jgi:hypothetical protein
VGIHPSRPCRAHQRQSEGVRVVCPTRINNIKVYTQV